MWWEVLPIPLLVLGGSLRINIVESDEYGKDE